MKNIDWKKYGNFKKEDIILRPKLFMKLSLYIENWISHCLRRQVSILLHYGHNGLGWGGHTYVWSNIYVNDISFLHPSIQVLPKADMVHPGRWEILNPILDKNYTYLTFLFYLNPQVFENDFRFD